METRGKEQLPDLRAMTFEETAALIGSMGEKPYRASQLFGWLHARMAASFDEMTDLSADLRGRLAEQTRLVTLEAVEVKCSAKDETKKFLFALPDGNIIESVLMKYKYGWSVCISSQVGCRMGCRFCASTLQGKTRDLSASEMLEQIYRISVLEGIRISHVVVMGAGEPLDNYDNLLRFIRLLCDPKGAGLSGRAITVSTCGLVPQIYDLAKEDLQITLALSLHAPTQEKRVRLMPIARKYPLPEVIKACRAYEQATGRRITFEYSLVRGENDTDEDAAHLARLLRGIRCHVNLIPVNPVKEREYRAPDRRAVLAFQNKLEKSGINVTIRREMGTDIGGACGQLRKSYLEEKEKE